MDCIVGVLLGNFRLEGSKDGGSTPYASIKIFHLLYFANFTVDIATKLHLIALLPLLNNASTSKFFCFAHSHKTLLHSMFHRERLEKE